MNQIADRQRPRAPIHHRLEEALLVALMSCLLALAFGQILLRNLFDATLLWADPLVRHLVLWSSLVGALIATRQGRHVRVDALLRVLPPTWKARAEAGGDAAAALVCLLLAGIALRFVADERSYGDDAFLGLPRWPLQLVFPFVFGGMGLRFLGRALAGAGLPRGTLQGHRFLSRAQAILRRHRRQP